MPAAIDWMEHVLGFERGAVPEEDGVVVHAQLAFGEDVIMVGTASDATPNGPAAVSPGRGRRRRPLSAHQASRRHYHH